MTPHNTVFLLLSLCRTGNMKGEITILRAINMHLNRANIDILQNVLLTLEADSFIVSNVALEVTIVKRQQ